MKASTHYALTRDNIIIAKGSARKMNKMKKPGDVVYDSPASKIGDRINHRSGSHAEAAAIYKLILAEEKAKYAAEKANA